MSRNRTKWLAVGVAMAAALVATAIPALAVDSPGAIQGQLTDGATPVSDAYVSLFDTDYNYIAFGVTDSTGAYQLTDVPAGTYKLQFSMQGFEQWVTQKPDFDAADVITVTGGETTTVNESVRPHGGMTGHVFNPDGSPAVDASVSAMKDGPEWESSYAYTDAEGHYTFPFLSPGEYRVSFRSSWDSPEQFAHDTSSYEDAALIPVTIGEVTTLDQTFVKLGAITGTVTQQGVPLEGVQVDVNSPTGSGYGWATTGPDGSYRVPLWPGSYNVTFRLSDGLTQYAPKQVDPFKAGLYTVAAGTDTVLNEKIKPTGTVTGELTDHTGAPAPFSSVELIGTWNTQFAYADGSGAFQFTAFPGPYQLAFHTDHGTQWSHGRSTPDTADFVSVEADTNLVVNEQLAEPGTLVVTAEDAASHDPVAEFCVDGNFGYHCTTTGTATIEGVLPGRYTVRHARQENEPYLGSDHVLATVSSGQTSTAALTLTRMASVTTVIRDADSDEPVANACLELIDVTAPMWHGVNTGNCSDESGNVTVPFLRPGSYKPFVWVNDGVHGMQWVGPDGGVGKFKEATTVTLTAGQSFSLDEVRLDGAGTITGTVTDEVTGAPIRNASVGLSTFNAGYGGGFGVPTDEQGRYTMSGLGPYGWTLYFSHWQYAGEWSGDSAYRDSAVGVMVQAGEATSYDTTLGLGTVVTGRVFGPNGKGSFARITVINAQSGDEMGAGDMGYSTIRYTVRVKGPQQVKLQYYGNVLGQYYGGWVGGTDFASATVFSVPATGTEKINVTMTEQEQ